MNAVSHAQDEMPEQPVRLFTGSFIAACAASLCLFSGIYLIMPILPVYLYDQFQASSMATGAILAAFTVAALVIRPLSGFLVDTFPGKRMYLILYGLFAACFFGYPFLTALIPLGILRFVHGLCFATTTTSGTSLTIATIPRSRLGSGIGFYGMTAALGMATGPMVGMLVLERFDYLGVFIAGCTAVVIGLCAGACVKAPPDTESVPRGEFSWRSLILPTGGYAFLSVAAAVFIYGLFLNYISLFAREKGLSLNIGYVFLLTSIGLITSRFFAGRLIDKGRLKAVIIYGKFILIVAFSVFTITTNDMFFCVAALLIGLGYGLVTPAYQTLFNNLAPPHLRGTANSMFFTAFDVGLGSSLLMTGLVGQFAPLMVSHAIGVGMLVFSLIFFVKKPHRITRYTECPNAVIF